MFCKKVNVERWQCHTALQDMTAKNMQKLHTLGDFKEFRVTCSVFFSLSIRVGHSAEPI